MLISETPDPNATSHAGTHGDYEVKWFGPDDTMAWGWYWIALTEDNSFGPYHTSQAAFGDIKDEVDADCK